MVPDLIAVHYVPIHARIGHIDQSSDPISFLWFEIDVFLPVFLANRAVVAVVANAVHFFETELLLFAFFSNDSDNNIVVFYQNYPYVKMEATLERKSLSIVELIGRSV